MGNINITETDVRKYDEGKYRVLKETGEELDTKLYSFLMCQKEIYSDILIDEDDEDEFKKNMLIFSLFISNFDPKYNENDDNYDECEKMIKKSMLNTFNKVLKVKYENYSQIPNFYEKIQEKTVELYIHNFNNNFDDLMKRFKEYEKEYENHRNEYFNNKKSELINEQIKYIYDCNKYK